MRLTKEGTPFRLKEPEQEAFCELQPGLQGRPVLAYFDENAETEMYTADSDIVLGAVFV